MAIALLMFGVVFAALCVWLTVRIVNRRERWVKWTLGVMLCLPVLYVLSFGPFVYLVAKGVMPERIHIIGEAFYDPLQFLDELTGGTNGTYGRMVRWYVALWTD